MRIALAIVALAVIAPAADAAEVQLKDGSIIYGTILSLVDGEDLIIDTEYMDEVTIEADAIVSVTDTQILEVEMFDGRRTFGTVTLDESGVSIAGDEPMTVNPADVFAIAEVNETFQDSLSVYTDLGMNIVRGNNQVTQVSFGAGADYDAQDFEASIDATTIINEQTDTQDTRRVTLGGNYTHKFGSGWQAIGLYQFESDEQQDLDGRSLYGAAISRRIINQRRHRVELYGGLGLNSEKFTDQSRSETLEGILGASYRMRWAADADVSFTIFPNLEESDRVRTQLDAELSFDLFSDLDFKITLYDRYDSDPPAGNDKNDTGLTLGLSWEY